MEHLPAFIPIVFVLTTWLTVFLLYKAARGSRVLLLLLISWLLLQAGISITGFYTHTEGMPPRILLLTLPPLLVIAGMFITAKGRYFLNGLELKILTLLHVIRIPVELVLFWLYVEKSIPGIMTFSGFNFDLLSGLTAPLVYRGFAKGKISKRFLLIWNLVCLLLLLNIVVVAVLSAPFPFQQLAFEQPDRAILYFPFTWLPGCIVPIVLLAHLAAIRNLVKR